MPLYDYRCENCSHEFESLQGMNQDPLTECPICSVHSLKKQASAPAFTFKGGGWYKDGYGSAGADKAVTPSTDSSKSEKSTTDSKPTKTDSGKSSTEKAKPSAKKTPSK